MFITDGTHSGQEEISGSTEVSNQHVKLSSNCSWQVLQDEVKQLMEEKENFVFFFCWFALTCKKTKDFSSLYLKPNFVEFPI